MAALRMKKNSAFLAYQLAASDMDSDASDSERREEHKSKQKAKKKSRAKKKNMCERKWRTGANGRPFAIDGANALVDVRGVQAQEEQEQGESRHDVAATGAGNSRNCSKAGGTTTGSAIPTKAPSPSNGPGPPSPSAQQQNGADLGAVYSPTHVKITRVDGQVANRQMQERLQRDAEIINELQNEVAMFRQMCLNLQAESSLSSSGGTKAVHRPPPGM
ncbi:hypothetical protein FI667_g4985, partial [Globisporangium splendens]